jgi:hypothetical protein
MTGRVVLLVRLTGMTGAPLSEPKRGDLIDLDL